MKIKDLRHIIEGIVAKSADCSCVGLYRGREMHVVVECTGCGRVYGLEVRLNRAEHRCLAWLATFCAPAGTELRTVSDTLLRLDRRGLVRLDGRHARITGLGLEALLASGRWCAGSSGEAPDGRECACPCHFVDAPHASACCDGDGKPLDNPRRGR